MELFEQKYRPNMERDGAILLALEGLRAGLDEGGSLAQVEVVSVDQKDGTSRLSGDEIQKFVARLPAATTTGRAGRS
jgi:20S proteasome alpha/beta subunit